MNLPSSIRFFFPGKAGFVLVIVCGIVGAGWVIKQGSDKRDAEREKHQITRPLGAVNPSESVDASQAAKESVLSNRRLNPGFTTAPEPVSVTAAPAFVPGRQAPLPTLVSFYSQVAATPSPTPEPERERPKPQEPWLPPSSFIPCTLVNTVESSHMNTPVVGMVLRDCLSASGKLVVPAGTIVSSFATAGAVNNKIEVAGTWLFVFADGRSLKVSGIACDREADPTNQQFGIEDGAAGLQGQLQETNHWANAQAFLALLMTTANQAITAGASSALSRGYGGGVALPDTSGIQAKYLDQLFNGQNGDSRFVRVSASTEFYIFPTEAILPNRRAIENSAKLKDEDHLPPLSGDPQQQALEMERQMLKQTQAQPTNEDQAPKFRY